MLKIESRSRETTLHPRAIRVARMVLSGALVFLSGCATEARLDTEATELARLLQVNAGSNVGEIGAGDGSMSAAMARIVGPNGHVYANELGTDELAAIRARAEKDSLSNITVIEGAVDDSNLPAGCCDAVFLRDVFHHFTKPAEMLASVRRALRPGGRLAVIDFPPTWWLAPWTPAGIPANRQGHGIPMAVLESDLADAAFEPVTRVEDWWGRNFCVVVRKR